MRDVLQEQIDYYRARAPEYDEWFTRTGRYDMGPELNARWRIEADEVRRALHSFEPRGTVLELAGGTGIWTQYLASFADAVVVVDASPEALCINRERVSAHHVRYVEANIFTWEPDCLYDVVFFGFWLSHVPPHMFEHFWSLIARWVGPGGRMFFVDNLRPSTNARDHAANEEPITTRELNDGRKFQIYKIWYSPAQLLEKLKHLGWRADVRATDNFFIYGWGDQALPVLESDAAARNG